MARLMNEPPDEPLEAHLWPRVRETCRRREGQECRYPFCRCLVVIEHPPHARKEAV